MLAGTFPRPSLVVGAAGCSRWWEMSGRVFVILPRECFLLYCKTVEHRSLKFRALADRRINSRSHIFVFVVTAFSAVACVLLHACSFVSHPSRRTGRDHSLDVVS